MSFPDRKRIRSIKIEAFLTAEEDDYTKLDFLLTNLELRRMNFGQSGSQICPS